MLRLEQGFKSFETYSLLALGNRFRSIGSPPLRQIRNVEKTQLIIQQIQPIRAQQLVQGFWCIREFKQPQLIQRLQHRDFLFTRQDSFQPGTELALGNLPSRGTRQTPMNLVELDDLQKSALQPPLGGDLLRLLRSVKQPIKIRINQRLNIQHRLNGIQSWVLVLLFAHASLPTCVARWFAKCCCFFRCKNNNASAYRFSVGS